jgi:hypothetical protein
MNKMDPNAKLVTGPRLRRALVKRRGALDNTAKRDMPSFLVKMVGRRKLRSFETEPMPRYRHD